MAIDFRARHFFHPLLIHRLRRCLEKTQRLPEEELRAYQNKLLSRTVQHAFEHVSFYRDLFTGLGLAPEDVGTVDDLPKLPLLSKEKARAAGEEMVADNARRYGPRKYQTSGTTGAPLTILHGRASNALEFAFYWRHWSWAQYRLGDHFAELHTTRFIHRGENCDRTVLWQPLLGRLLLNSLRVGRRQATGLARQIRKHRCLYLKGLASSLYAFALACRDAGVADLRFRAVFSTGEIMLAHIRRLIETVFNSPVLDSYGHMERTMAVTQCPQGGYHVNADYGVLEVVNLKPGDDGQTLIGRAVGTSLYNPVMPFLRYDTGDSIEVFRQPRSCPCGRTLPLVKAIHGRQGDMVVTPDGRYLTSLYVLPDILGGIRFIQFIQESPTRLVVQVVPDSLWNEEQHRRTLLTVRRALGPDMEMSLRLVGLDDLVRDCSGKIRSVLPLTGSNKAGES